PVGRVDVDHLDLAAQVLVVKQRLHYVQRVAAYEFVLPALVVGVELDALASVALAERLLEVGEEVTLSHGARCPLSGASHALDDLCNARLGDDLVALEGQDRDLTAVALPRPKEDRV